MNILFISVRADHGGGPYSTFKLASEFADRNYRVYAALPKDKPYYDLFCSKLSADAVVTIPHRKVSWRAIYRLATFIKANKIQIIHSNGKGAGAYAKFLSILCRVSFIHTPRGIHIFSYSRLGLYLYRLYENNFNFYCKCVVFVSESEKEKARKLSLWSSVPVAVIANGINLSKTRESVRMSLEGKKSHALSKFTVATTTRFDNSKNMDEALEIARICSEIEFVWIGDGPDKERIVEKARLTGSNNIIFWGESENPVNLLAYCNAYLSTSRWEGLPNALLEAGLMSLPSVASKVTGNIDVVSDGYNGFLYNLGDIKTAAKRLRYLRANKDASEKLGRLARANIENHFSEEKTFMLYHSAYKEAVACS